MAAKLYGYCRASTYEQETTLAVQADVIEKEYHHRFEQEYEWGGLFSDRGVSGSKPIRQRPEGHKLSMALESGDAIVFTKMDRGFRNAGDACTTIEAWFQRGIRVVLMDFNADSGTAAGRMTIQMLAVFAEFERSRMRERIMECIAHRKRLGLPNGKAPYGLKMTGPAGKRYAVKDPYTRRIGAKILEWHLAGWSRAAIYIHLLANRIKTREGKEWTESGVRRAIAGEMRLQQEEREKQQPTA